VLTSHLEFAATTLTSWHLLVTFCSLHVALWMKLFEHKPFDPRAVMGFGILNGISIGLLNLSLGFNSVGFYQVHLLLWFCYCQTSVIFNVYHPFIFQDNYNEYIYICPRVISRNFKNWLLGTRVLCFIFYYFYLFLGHDNTENAESYAERKIWLNWGTSAGG